MGASTKTSTAADEAQRLFEERAESDRRAAEKAAADAAAYNQRLLEQLTPEQKRVREEYQFLNIPNAIDRLVLAGIMRPRIKPQLGVTAVPHIDKATLSSRAITKSDVHPWGVGVDQDAVEQALGHVVVTPCNNVSDPSLQKPGTLFVHNAGLADYVTPEKGTRCVAIYEEDVLLVCDDMDGARAFFAEEVEALERATLGPKE